MDKVRELESLEKNRTKIVDVVLGPMPTYTKTLLAGGVAGGVAKTCVAPLERLKILYQTRHKKFQSMGVVRSLSCILSTEGVRAFYKGNGASVLRIVPYNAVSFLAYEQYKDWILNGCPTIGTGPVVDLFAGSLAGGTAVMCTYPLDLARTRLAFQDSNHPTPYKGIKDVCTQAFQKGGVRGLYRGLCPTLYGNLPYVGLKFFLYEMLKGHLPNEWEQSLSAKLACGAAAGVTSQTIIYPLDVVRRQMQVQSESSLIETTSTRYKGTLGTCVKITQTQGWRQLYAGLSINYMKTMPATAIGFATYETMKDFLQVPPREKKM